jgi:hypothetical protein
MENAGKEFRIVFRINKNIPKIHEDWLRDAVQKRFKDFKKGVRDCPELSIYFEEV